MAELANEAQGWADHARAWFAAISRPEVRIALEAVYAHVSREIAQRGPACWASGRCCHFERAGHRLYVTGLEGAYTLIALRERDGLERSSPGSSHRSGDDAASHAFAPAASLGASRPVLSLPQVEASRARGDCPILRGNICDAHAEKPLGCRVYFCERGTQAWQSALSEDGLARIRAIHDAHEIPYVYAEWRTVLAWCVRALG